MTRDEFLAEVRRRGYPRDWIFFQPGEDDQRNPEGGGVIIASPSARTGGGWRTYQLERGVRNDHLFDTESALYDWVLATYFEPRPDRGPTTRDEFLAEVERRGGRRSWFCFRDASGGGDEPREGQVVIEQRDTGVRVYRRDRGVRDERTFDHESEAWRHLLDELPGGRR